MPPQSRTLTEGEFTAIKQALLNAAPEGLSEADFQRWFQPRFDGAIAEAEHSTQPVSGGSLRRDAESRHHRQGRVSGGHTSR
jgi:hypothetical protein